MTWRKRQFSTDTDSEQQKLSAIDLKGGQGRAGQAEAGDEERGREEHQTEQTRPGQAKMVIWPRQDGWRIFSGEAS